MCCVVYCITIIMCILIIIIVTTTTTTTTTTSTTTGEHLRFTDEHYSATLLAFYGYGSDTHTTCSNGFTATDWSHPPRSRKPVHPKEYSSSDISGSGSGGSGSGGSSGSSGSDIITKFKIKQYWWNNITTPNPSTNHKYLSRQFGHGSSISGGCSGSILCHYNMRKVKLNKDASNIMLTAVGSDISSSGDGSSIGNIGIDSE